MAQVIISGVNCGYPTIRGLADLYSEPTRTRPYPKYMMRCSESVSGGYPAVICTGVRDESVTSGLCFGSRGIVGMYYKGYKIKSAYCNEEKVFAVQSHE